MSERDNGNRGLSVRDFRGLRTDRSGSFLDPDWLADVLNFSYDSRIGLDRMLYPETVLDIGSSVDGIYEFRYLDRFNVSRTVDILVAGGSVYRNWKTAPVEIWTGLTAALCEFEVYRDRLWIVNGKNYPIVYDGSVMTQMGQPVAIDANETGNPDGEYSYQMTYLDASGEYRLGTVSNTVEVAGSKISLTFPTGWTGTINRKIYRTKSGSGDYWLVHDIGDNTTTTWTDDVADAALVTPLSATSKDYIKPAWIKTISGKLLMSGDDRYPTQVWNTETNLLVADTDSFADISNVSGDNTPVTGLELDYSLVIAGSRKNLYVIDASGATLSVTQTRSNVGVLDGHTMRQVPANEDFPGGVLFVSTLYDVRLFSGNFAQPVATSLDNLTTSNWSWALAGSLDEELKESTSLYSIFHEYRYYVITPSNTWIFDIRGNRWTRSSMYSSEVYRSPVCAGISAGLYIGNDDGTIDLSSQLEKYNGEIEITAYFRTARIGSGHEVKRYRSVYLHFDTSSDTELIITITIDGNRDARIRVEWTKDYPAFSDDFEAEFLTGGNPSDYVMIPVDRTGHWIEIEVSTTRMFRFRGFDVDAELIAHE